MADTLPIDDSSKIVIMSDCHRGSGSYADDFAKNRTACLAALKYYYTQRYIYIELGDSDELWKNKDFADISAMYSEIFMLLAQFYKENRLYELYGNHDLEKKYKPDLLDTYYDVSGTRAMPLFPGITVHAALRLYYMPARKDLLLIHGHQVDFLNNELWKLARFLVRHFWKPLELIGFNDPTSAAKNNKVKEKVEKRLTRWTEETNVPLVAGHTHRPVFPSPGKGLYFNDGSCVHPWSITAIEIVLGKISLVRWEQKTRADGTVYIGKDTIGGPIRIAEYLSERYELLFHIDEKKQPG